MDFIAGLIIGAFIGMAFTVVFMAMMFAAKRADERMEKER